MASYGVWWIELVVALVVLMCLGLVAREAAAFISIARIRQRDGGIPAPRTREEYLLLFPRACPRCLSRRGQRITGWHRDRYGAAEFVDTWQCVDCAYVADGRQLLLLWARRTPWHGQSWPGSGGSSRQRKPNGSNALASSVRRRTVRALTTGELKTLVETRERG